MKNLELLVGFDISMTWTFICLFSDSLDFFAYVPFFFVD